MSGGLVREALRLGDCHVRRVLPDVPSGPPVVMIPGAHHGGRAWRFWLEGFAAAGLPSHALSFPNHEDAAVLDDAAFCALRLDDYVARAEAVVAAAEERAGRAAVIVGHSLGGVVAQRLAVRRQPAALVLVASAGPAALGITRAALFPEDRPVACPPERARRLFFHDVEEDVLAEALAGLSAESPGVMNGSGGRAEVPREAVRCPVLVAAGAEDASGVIDQARLAAHYGAPLIRVPGTGHDVMLERRRMEAAEAVLAWLAALEPRAGR